MWMWVCGYGCGYEWIWVWIWVWMYDGVISNLLHVHVLVLGNTCLFLFSPFFLCVCEHILFSAL